MGRRRFRLSDMMPNSWFYKLREMRRGRGGDGSGAGGGTAMQPPSRGAKPASPARGSVALPHRASYYYATRDREPPPSSSPVPRPRAAATDEDRLLFPGPQSPENCSRTGHIGGVELGPVAQEPDASQRRRDMYVVCDGGDVRRPTATVPSEEILDGKVIVSEKDITIDLRAKEDAVDRVLRPIMTRPARRDGVRYDFKDRHVDVADAMPRAGSASEKGGKGNRSPRRSSVSTGRRLRTRANSPRLVYRKGKPSTPPAAAASPRKTSPAPPLAESFAVVKASADPRKDFQESMEEMIAEKGIHDAADLEDLLACYLALNAAEHHDIIVEVFEQIWTRLATTAAP